jgi:hypothetical protein
LNAVNASPVRLLRASLEAGHWRVALRRYLMLKGAAAEIPEDLAAECERVRTRCEPHILQRMLDDVHAWAQLVTTGHCPRKAWPGARAHAGAAPPRDKLDDLHRAFRPLRSRQSGRLAPQPPAGATSAPTASRSR